MLTITYLDGIVHFDVRVRVADGSSVMGNAIWNLVLSKFLLQNLAELEGSFFGVNFDNIETTFDIHKNTEVFACLVD